MRRLKQKPNILRNTEFSRGMKGTSIQLQDVQFPGVGPRKMVDKLLKALCIQVRNFTKEALSRLGFYDAINVIGFALPLDSSRWLDSSESQLASLDSFESQPRLVLRPVADLPKPRLSLANHQLQLLWEFFLKVATASGPCS